MLMLLMLLTQLVGKFQERIADPLLVRPFPYVWFVREWGLQAYKYLLEKTFLMIW